MQVASLENSKKLYELSAWICNPLHRVQMGGDMKEKRWEEQRYDLGYLLRKLPKQLNEEQKFYFHPAYKKENEGMWCIGYRYSGTIGFIAETPEDVACLLSIKLFEEGILTAPSPDKASK